MPPKSESVHAEELQAAITPVCILAGWRAIAVSLKFVMANFVAA